MTKQERIALFFLSGVFFFGTILHYGLKVNPRLFRYIDYMNRLPAPVKVNINTATRDQLIDLPDIGETMADRIIDFRRENGDIKTLYDLRAIKGMTEKRIKNIKPFLKIGAPEHRALEH